MNNSITTIIPFFNSEHCLGAMLDSILAGDVVPNEILLIDDGSTDNSATIAKNYESKHPNVHYLSQEHAGVSAARNLGIQQATGKWISFLDADDYVEPNMYKAMLDSVENTNLSGCVCGYFTEKDGITTAYTADFPATITGEQLLEAMFLNDNVRGFLFTRLFSAQLVKQNLFDTDISMCEDLLFQSKLLCNHLSDEFGYVNKPFYHYIQNSASATNSANYFNDGVFKYKPAFTQIFDVVNKDYVWASYNSIIEYSMYTLLQAYKKGNHAVKEQIRLLQIELKATPCQHKSKHRIAYEYAPILFSLLSK